MIRKYTLNTHTCTAKCRNKTAVVPRSGGQVFGKGHPPRCTAWPESISERQRSFPNSGRMRAAAQSLNENEGALSNGSKRDNITPDQQPGDEPAPLTVAGKPDQEETQPRAQVNH